MKFRARDCRFVFSIFLAVLAARPSCAQAGQTQSFTEKSQQIPLQSVIAVTESALDEYQKEAEIDVSKSCRNLPPLQTADFEFKTVVDTKGGLGINLFIFTLGANREKQQTTDIDFQYQPRAKHEATIAGFGPPPKTLYQQLLETLRAASSEIAKGATSQTTSAGKADLQLDLKQVSVTIAFGATTDVPIGVKVPFQLITATGSLDRNKNNVQQVKLSFQNDPKVPMCGPRP